MNEDQEFQDLLKAHAVNVEASQLAWSALNSAQDECRRLRKLEHDSAEAIEQALMKRLGEMVRAGDERFKPVPISL